MPCNRRNRKDAITRGIMATIASNLQAIHTAIADAALRIDRSQNEVTLLAVSKTFSSDAIRQAFQAGQHCFAENYVQEALVKMAELRDFTIEWHFIGPIQSNKTRAIAESFAWVHSVDRLKIAERLSVQRPPHMPPLQICLQVNISNEASKSGVSPAQLATLADEVSKLPNLTLRGLMTVPAATENESAQRAAFAQLHELYEQLKQQGLPLDTLSMGMSHDFTAAIAEGATMLRIGTAIFGARIYQEETP